MRILTASIVVGAAGSCAFAELPLLWRVELQARSTNAALIGTFNLPARATMTSKTPAMSDDGFAAVHFSLPSGQGVDGFFVGRDGAGSTPIVTATGPGFTGADLDFKAGLLGTVTSAAPPLIPSAVSVRNASTGAETRRFDAPNAEGVTTFTRPRILDGGGAVGYRGLTSLGVRKWIVDSFTGTARSQTVYLQEGPAVSFLYAPTTNAALHMGGKVDDGNGVGSIVRADSPTARTTVFNGAAGNVDFIAGGTDMNDDDELAFFVRFNLGPTTRFSLLRSDGVTTTTMANAGDAGIVSATMGNFPPSINNDGVVAFRAQNASGDGLYVADGVRIVRVIGAGDTVQTDLGNLTLGFGGNGLSGTVDINASKQVAFCGVLSNGSVGLFIATPCFADFNGDMVIDFFDYLDFVDVFSAGSAGADFNGDGITDFFDYLDFVDAFADGC